MIHILKSTSPIFVVVLFLAGCGTTTGLDNPFVRDRPRVVTVYVAEQNLNVAVTQASDFPTGWESSPGTVVEPQLGALVGSTPTILNQTLEDGTTQKPYNDSTLFWNFQETANTAYLDPNAWVKSNTNQTYNLAWGTPDVNGPGFVLNHDSSDNFRYQVATPETVWTKELSGSTTAEGPKLLSPGSDVLAAWAKGWTGAGTRVLIIDGAFGQTGDFVLDNHGIIVSRVLGQYAPGATLLYKDLDTDDFLLTSAPSLLDGTPSSLVGSNPVHAVNLSFSFNFPLLNSATLSVLKGQAGFVYEGVDLTDATVTASAGNDTSSLTSLTSSLPFALVNDAVTLPRTLIVGAIEVDATDGGRALASYSNTPGTSTTLQNRFLVASGQASWAEGYFAIDGTQVSALTTQGTSFAAPRVAAFASILRQKFPSISGEQAASILLDTATTEGLSCFPNCSAQVYGRGEVSLTRALAPIGRLR